MELSSASVQPTIPWQFAQGNAFDAGFPRPALSWSTPPAGTSEVAGLAQLLTDDNAGAYQGAQTLWWDDGVPRGQTRWTVTGIPATAAALPESSQADPLPAGIVEQARNAVSAVIDGEPDRAVFVARTCRASRCCSRCSRCAIRTSGLKPIRVRGTTTASVGSKTMRSPSGGSSHRPPGSDGLRPIVSAGASNSGGETRRLSVHTERHRDAEPERAGWRK